jgi:DNA mismatch repair protein MutS
VRKQTLTNAERYITEELKQYEEKILGAEGENSEDRRNTLRGIAGIYVNVYSRPAAECFGMARLDCLCSYATVAMKYGYVKPTLMNR